MRSVHGPYHVALRFARTGGDPATTSTYAELRDDTNRFTDALSASWASAPATPSSPWSVGVPELYVSVLGSLKPTARRVPRCSRRSVPNRFVSGCRSAPARCS